MMSDDHDDSLFAIEVDTDDYAETAAGDTPSVPRTFQSEADYQAQKASYRAKIDTGNNLDALYRAVPYLRPSAPDANELENEECAESQELKKKIVLGKKDVMLLGYALGEMYYERRYQEIIELCERVEEVCLVEGDKKLGEALGRWRERCKSRMSSEVATAGRG
ncbi:uncharacterized protein CLAFUR5_13803 [Fulvia fulva]|uniref:Uncharacterized protein n=1 Tax=Passalora fulva TaxID=5499 RepID=A0A9Q8PLK9_PASFU|nr:uncharacterized protein CLAFUR5_13803 [Fulvia fulva]UJO24786.1 hypothetical protein CLAFUR5_13803 [Fulvia fulva]WPV37093.1 hypothetical protein CLAFUW7_13971 [Fulvia fulva]